MSDRIFVLDGGMGTTLEALGHDVSGEMWGSDLIASNPEIIKDVHRRWIDRSQVDIIETATYQMTPQGLYDAGYSEEEAIAIMADSIRLASDAIASASTPMTGNRPVQIALSLGPFGATLKPSQEYSGIYPPPYGPSNRTVNYFPRDPTSPTSAVGTEDSRRIDGDEEESITRLADFHFRRLRMYASDLEVWRKVSWIAFETVPVVVEIKGIRRAMKIFQEHLKQRIAALMVGESSRENSREVDVEWWDKPWWITSGFPNGRHPQMIETPAATSISADGLSQGSSFEGSRAQETGHISMESLLRILLLPEPDYAIPTSIGINCTHPQYLAPLIQEYNKALTSFLQSPEYDSSNQDRPVFVLYPDGGAVYDTSTKTWTSRSYIPKDWAIEVSRRAKELAEAKDARGDYLWKGVIVGGCCKSSFEETGELSKKIRQGQ